MPQYRVKNWHSFQHYKDRSPPWIRLYKGLLDDYDFHCLPDASRALAPMLWLLASDNKDPNSGLIDGPDERIAFRLRMSVSDFRKAIKPLIDNGFIDSVHDASGALAERQQHATPETEAETDSTEAETVPPLPPTNSLMPFVSLPDDWRQWAAKDRGWDDSVINDIWSAFREYWTTGRGKTTKRADWAATWRTWCRKENIKPKGHQHGKHGNFAAQDYRTGTDGFVT